MSREGFLLAPRLRDTLLHLHTTEDATAVGLFEIAREKILRSDTLQRARHVHASERLHLLDLAQGGAISIRTLQVGEFTIDYTLIQHALQYDVQTAARERSPLEPISSLLAARWDGKHLAFHAACAHVRDPEAIYGALSAPAQERILHLAFQRSPCRIFSPAE